MQIKLRLSGARWLMRQANRSQDVGSHSLGAHSSGDGRDKAELMFESIRLAERSHPLSIACLGKSLVLHKMLRGIDIPAVLRIGVNLNKEDQTDRSVPMLSSHSWVEIGGVPVGEPDDVQTEFIELDTH